MTSTLTAPASIDSPAEGRLRIELAAALRWAARHDLHEAAANHFSVAIDDDAFLMNPAGRMFARVRAGDLLRLPMTAVETDERPAGADPTAWFLHGQLHRHVPRARVVVHTHMPYTTTLACLADGRLEMLDQNACRFFGRIAYDRGYAGMALDTAEGERVAGLIGDHDVLLLGNHGVIVIGETVAEAFDDLYYLERAARLQVLAMATGRPLSRVPDDVAAVAAAQWRGYSEAAHQHLAEVIAVLDEEEPDFRD